MNDQVETNVTEGVTNKTLFSRMNIGMRIGSSMTLILLLLIAVSLFSLDIFRQSEQSFADFSAVNDETVSILEIDRQVAELQRLILAFSNTGHSSFIKTAKELHVELMLNMSTIQASIQDEERLIILIDMGEVLNEYGDNIEPFIEARELRDQLVDESMFNLQQSNMDLIKRLHTEGEYNSGEYNGREEILVGSQSIQQNLLFAQADATTFFNRRKYAYSRNAKKLITKAKLQAETLLNTSGIPASVAGELSQLMENIKEYERVFFQALQATRGYLFLVNVVMAGQATEFTTLSEQLKASSLKKLSELKKSTEKRTIEAKQTTTFVTIAAILFGVMLSILISRNISRPIRGIASTFDRLVNDEEGVTIPGLDRGDEIGQLAKAANIFKDMNQRTKEILRQTQRLSKELQSREAQLEIQTIELKKSNDELDNFAYVASHDLKSPLRAIDNLSLWIQEDCAEILPEESRDHFDKIRQRIVRMENLLASLLNYSRVGKTDVSVEEVDSAELVRDVIALIDFPKTFSINIDSEMPKLTTAITPLQQVFQNLLTNSIKYNEGDKGVINIWGALSGDELVEFTVQDNGPGIEPKFHERIFQMFQTLQARDVIESSGMGLAIIKKVIEGYGGEISVESDLGEGATFRFTWPRVMEAAPEH